jgi:hypothetical protein
MASSSGRLVRLSRHKVMDLAIFATCSIAFSLLLSLRACLISWLWCFKERSSHTMPGINCAQEGSSRPRLVEAVFPIADPVEHFKLDITRSSRRHRICPTPDFDDACEYQTKQKERKIQRGSRISGPCFCHSCVTRHDADPDTGRKMPVPVFVEWLLWLVRLSLGSAMTTETRRNGTHTTGRGKVERGTMTDVDRGIQYPTS